jgi:hypothetical protein
MPTDILRSVLSNEWHEGHGHPAAILPSSSIGQTAVRQIGLQLGVVHGPQSCGYSDGMGAIAVDGN